MIRNYLKTIVRIIVRQPVFSAINILGLSIAITCVVFISLWVWDELSYDRFHQSRDQIYRVMMNLGEYGNLAVTPPPLIGKIKEDFPEINHAARVKECPEMVIKNGDLIFREEEGIFVDPEFFDIFSFDLLRGHKPDLLKDPYSIVLTEVMAKKYFDTEDPVNKTLYIDGQSFTVTGVLRNIPENSHLQFNFILPVELLTHFGNNLESWGNVNLYSYIEVVEGTDFSKLNEKIIEWKTPRKENFFLQPLESIHQEPDYVADNSKICDKKYVRIFSSIALFILLIACVNYITLYISSSLNRMKEIDIRKVIGSSRKNLFFQFLGESTLFIIIGLILSDVFTEVLSPLFNDITQKNYTYLFHNYYSLPFTILFGVLLLLIIGVYPAIYLSKFKPSLIIKEKGKDKILPISRLKNMMVLIQFSITTVLLIGIILISKQLNYIHDKNLGFNKENIVYMPFRGIGEHYDNFRQALLKNPEILNVTAKNSLPIESADKTSSIYWPGKNPDDDLLMEATGVDFRYIETIGLNIVEGRDFSPDYPTDKYSFMLNQAALKQMKLVNPIGKVIKLWGYQGSIIGIVNDALFYSLKEKTGPQILYMIQDIKSQEMSDFGVLLVKIAGNDVRGTISSIQSAWKDYFPDIPFSFSFLDKAIESRYNDEKRLFMIMQYFAILSIIVSCLGLFGISLFSVERRTKEIGIHKVNGATISEVMVLLNKDFVRWILIAFVIAIPTGYFVMYKWLEGFAYKTSLSWWIFAFAGITALIIALITVSWQSWKAATRNPVESLRYE
jgi:putative ABC transport system permease protein